MKKIYLITLSLLAMVVILAGYAPMSSCTNKEKPAVEAPEREDPVGDDQYDGECLYRFVHPLQSSSTRVLPSSTICLAAVSSVEYSLASNLFVVASITGGQL